MGTYEQKKIRTLAIVIGVICGICLCIFALVTWQLEYFGIAISLFVLIGSSAALTTGKFTPKHLFAVVFLIASLALLIGLLLWLFGSEQIKSIIKANAHWLICGGIAMFSVLLLLAQFICDIWRKKVCTQSVMAECTDVEIRRRISSGHTLTSCTAQLSYYYNGENHIMSGGSTSNKILFKKGERYELMINSNDMTTFYYATKKYNGSPYTVSIGFLAFAGILLAIFYFIN